MAIIDEITNRISAVIPALNNSSASSIATRMMQVFAAVVDTTILNNNNSISAITNAARTLRVAGRKYYIDTALAFQEGDNLVMIDPASFKYGYATIDPTKQIIKQVAINTVQISGTIIMKVATQNVDGYNTPLTSVQLSSFASYMQSMAPLGISMPISSPAASIVSATKLVIHYSNSYSLTTIQNTVKTVLITTQGMLVGDSPVFVNDMEGALKNIDGVRDAYFVNITADGTPPTNGVLTPASGYYNFDEELTTLRAVEFISMA